MDSAEIRTTTVRKWHRKDNKESSLVSGGSGEQQDFAACRRLRFAFVLLSNFLQRRQASRPANLTTFARPFQFFFSWNSCKPLS